MTENISNIVEGVWGKFTFKFIEKSDYPIVLEFIRTEFLRDELICSRLPDDDGEDSFEDFKILYEWVFDLGDNLSFIALDNETGEIAAVRATFIQRQDFYNTWLDSQNFRSRKMKGFLRVGELCDSVVNPFDRFGIDHFASFITGCTGRRYRRQGLASEMYKRSVTLLKERNVPFVRSIFSSPWNRKATADLKFREYCRIFLKDVRDDNGLQMIPNATDNDFGIFGGLWLQ